MSSKLETLLSKLGQPGKRQSICALLLIYSFMHSVCMNYIISFITMIPPHQCKMPEDWSWPKNISIPHRTDANGFVVHYDSCHYYSNPINHSYGLKSCDVGYEYRHLNGYERFTIPTEWNLVCGDRYLVRIFQLLYFFGVLFGGLMGGFLCDLIGRRPILISYEIVYIAIGIGTYFARDFTIFCILIFILGMAMQSKLQSAYALIMEMFPVRYRTVAGIASLTAPALSYGISTGLAYFCPNWRLQILIHSFAGVLALFGACRIMKNDSPLLLLDTISSAFFLLIFPIYFTLVSLTPESIRWLVSQQRTAEALDVCRSIARFNGIVLPPSIDMDIKEMMEEVQSNMSSTKKQTLVDLLRYSMFRRYSFIVAFSQYTAQLSIYGFSFLVNEIGGDLYLNCIIISLIDTLLRTSSYFTVKKLGRKKMSLIALAVMGVMNLAFVAIRSFGHLSPIMKMVSIVVGMTGRVFNGMFFCSFYILMSEMFPTTVRSSAQGVVSASGRAGLMSTPLVLFLGDYIWKQFPFLLFGVMGVFSSVLCSFLPETRGQPMPTTIEEAARMTKKVKKSSTTETTLEIKDTEMPMIVENGKV